MLYQSGQKVLHYSSPHIKRFNERIWIDGDDIDDEVLDTYHQKLLTLLNGAQEDLSYFEYSTLLALLISNEVDFLVLEAGLGGEFDATNVIESDITILTTVGLDHQEFLGESIKEIAATKVRACDNLLVVAKQVYDEVYEICDQLVPQNIKVQSRDDFFVGGFLGDNIQTAVKVFEMLGFNFDKNLIKDFSIKARAQKIRPNVMVDVGHNPLAASAIFPLIENDTVLVYNALKDKDVAQVLKILSPKLQRIEILPIENERVINPIKIRDVAKQLGLEITEYQGLQMDCNYLVFGSFFTVEKFLELEGM